MTDLDRWHEIHDAYVTFFGDDHRPAAVACADRGDQHIQEVTFAPGEKWMVDDLSSLSWVGSYVQVQRNPYKIDWLEDDLMRHKANIERRLLG